MQGLFQPSAIWATKYKGSEIPDIAFELACRKSPEGNASHLGIKVHGRPPPSWTRSARPEESLFLPSFPYHDLLKD